MKKESIHTMTIRFVMMITMLMMFCVNANAQTGVVRKSAKTETVDGKKYYIHTVEKGQTLYAIAKAYDMTVNDVLVENPDALNGIKPGQVLRIPYQKQTGTTTVTPVPTDTAKYELHKVEAGETIYGICKKYNTTEAVLNSLNPDLKNGLKVGQEIKIPGAVSSTSTTTVTNVVTTAIDTSFKIVRKDVYNI